MCKNFALQTKAIGVFRSQILTLSKLGKAFTSSIGIDDFVNTNDCEYKFSRIGKPNKNFTICLGDMKESCSNEEF
jgi:hypothetical protein